MIRRQFLRASAMLPVALARPSRLFAAEFDLIIRGGRVLDASQNIDRIADVGIRDGRIAAIETSIGPPADVDSATKQVIVDARGKLVTPGLIDIHTHLADKEMPPAKCLADGVTSLLDAGSLGAENVEPLVKIAQGSPNRVRILLNIANHGIAPGGVGELLDLSSANVAAAHRAIERNRKWIVGIKARLSRTVAGEHDLEALRRARQVADPLKVPIMVHVGQTASPLPAILALLRPGDIVTHLYSPPPNGILDNDGKVLPQVRDARKRGVLFDVGNGRTGHWTWEVAERAMQQDFLPDTISSDLTAASRTYQVFNFPNVLSKFLLLGMPVDQVIARATTNAARAIPEFKAYGTLKTGAAADVTVLDLQQGDFDFVDNLDAVRRGHQKLVAHAVIIGGKRLQV
jgi:dihydroorotase